MIFNSAETDQSWDDDPTSTMGHRMFWFFTVSAWPKTATGLFCFPDSPYFFIFDLSFSAGLVIAPPERKVQNYLFIMNDLEAPVILEDF